MPAPRKYPDELRERAVRLIRILPRCRHFQSLALRQDRTWLRGLRRTQRGSLSTYMGHASIRITLDRYGHLMPGNEAEASQLLEAS